MVSKQPRRTARRDLPEAARDRPATIRLRREAGRRNSRGPAGPPPGEFGATGGR